MSDPAPSNSAVHKVLDVLLLFDGQDMRLSADEISHQLHIPKSTIYRYIRILVDKGLLEKAGAAHYCLGLKFIDLGRKALASNREIRLVALPSMKRLAEVAGESISLMRLYNRQVVCIESIEGRPALRVTIERGRIQPLHAGASSKILLAGIPFEEWPSYLELPLRRFTDTTTTDLDALKAEIETVRQTGYCVSDGEIDVGARAVAVPLVNRHNEIVAALSIEAPLSRMTDATVLRFLELLREEAGVINQQLS